MNFAAIRDQLLRHEGLVKHVYQDHLGYWTIGVGRLIDKRRGGGISQAEAMMLLNNDIARLAGELGGIDAFKEAPERVQRALVNMAFQLGVEGLLGFERMWECLEWGDWEGAADEALDSRWAKQTPNRAREVAAMIRSAEEAA